MAGAVYSGSATGAIPGAFRAVWNLFPPAGTARSRFPGSGVIAEGATPANIVFGAVSGASAPAPTGCADLGPFAGNGGLGAYGNAHRRGSLPGASAAAMNASGSITWTRNSVPGLGPHPGHGKAQNG